MSSKSSEVSPLWSQDYTPAGLQRILLVVADDHDQQLFCQALAQSHPSTEIITARQAEAALEKLRAKPAAYDVVVIDHDLPGVTGLTLCRAILADQIPIPLVMLTEDGGEQLAIEAFRAGVSDYFIKDDQQQYLIELPQALSRVAQKYQADQIRQKLQLSVQEVFQQVERAKQEWETTIDALSQLICLLDNKGRVMRANRTVETWRLAMVRSVKGRTLHNLLHPNCTDPNCYLKIKWPQAWHLIRQGQTTEFEAEDQILGRHLDVQVRPIASGNKPNDSCATVVIHDITKRKLADQALQKSLRETQMAYQQAQMYAHDLKAEINERQRAEETLRRQAAELQARNEELDAFAHTVAHDLKNPLGPIIGYAEFVHRSQATMSPAELNRSTYSISRNARKMLGIIDALLLLSGVRNMEIKPEPVDMGGIIFEVQHRLTDMIEEYQPQFILPETWPLALGYAPWIEEVWANYLTNALKYGGQPPCLKLGATPQADGQIRFWIHDNGPGLTPAEQVRLFTPFTQVNRGQAKGHGLGLSIVQRIVDRLGGEVGVESKGIPGEGSLFYFTLPGVGL